MNIFRKKSSGSMARERLKLLLVSDRASCSPDVMEMIKDDIIQVLSRYLEIDVNALDIRIAQIPSGDGHEKIPALFANVPIIQRIC